MNKNIKHLEDKVSNTISEREDIIIKLKSELILYKNKLNQYKSRLRKPLDGVETKRIEEI